jgi:iron complex transport system substrate-binding protein
VTKRGRTTTTAATRHIRLQRIERAVDRYLRHCYQERSSAKVKELAGFLQLSRPYLSRAVAGVSKVALRELMRRKQAAYAEELLRHTDLPLREVALRSAFGDVKTLYRAFVKWYGVRPGEFRKRLPNAHRRDTDRAVSSQSSIRKDGNAE